jgi:hypothetical protein
MTERLPPLEPDIAEVLRAEKAPLRAPPEEKARALGRVLAAAGESIAGERAAPSRRGAGGISAWARAHPLAVAATAFALGTAAGVALHASLVGERIVYVTHTITVPANAPESPVRSAEPLLPSGPPALSGAPAPSAHGEERKGPAAASARPLGDTLAAERAIIDVARRAVGSGDGAAAMAALSRHERSFPSGLLQEEREALTIRALVLLGDMAEARSRATQFHARYPGSLMAPAVDRAVASPPDDGGNVDEGSP